MSKFNHYPSSIGELHSCYLAWLNTNKVLRFGQYMVNNYYHLHEPWPELFYCEDTMKAYEMCANEVLPNTDN